MMRNFFVTAIQSWLRILWSINEQLNINIRNIIHNDNLIIKLKILSSGMNHNFWSAVSALILNNWPISCNLKNWPIIILMISKNI